MPDTYSNQQVYDPIDTLPLTFRSVNALKKTGIEYIGQLIHLTEVDLLKIPNLGKKSINDIKEALRISGFTLTATPLSISTEESYSNQQIYDPIDTLPLTFRLANALKKTGIEYIGQLIHLTEADLLIKMPNLGKKSINEIKEALRKVSGFTLAATPLSISTEEYKKYNNILTLNQLSALAKPIAALGWSKKTQDFMRKYAIITLRDLVKREASEFNFGSNNGRRCIKEFNMYLQSVGLSLGMTSIDEFIFNTKNKYFNENLIDLGKLYINWNGFFNQQQLSYYDDVLAVYGSLDIKSIQSMDVLTHATDINKHANLLNLISEAIANIKCTDDAFDINCNNFFSLSPFSGFFLADTDKTVSADVEKYALTLDDRRQDIFLTRWGIHTKTETLETLGKRYDCTRERVRQISVKLDVAFLQSLSLTQSIIKKLITDNIETEFAVSMPILYRLFNRKADFYSFIEFISGVDKHEFINIIRPGLKRAFINEFFLTRTSPINADALIDELTTDYGYTTSLSKNLLREAFQKGFVKEVGKGIIPIGMGKSEAIAHILLGHPSGLPWKDIVRLTNSSGVCATTFPEDRQISSGLSQSDYVYLCERGCYKSIKYLPIQKYDMQAIFSEIANYFDSTNNDSVHLNGFYNQAPSWIKTMPYYDLRYLISEYSSEYSFHFNGTSGVDSIGLSTSSPQMNQQKLLLQRFNESEVALTVQEIAAKLVSKSVAHARFYIDKMRRGGQIIRVDKTTYTTPEKAFRNLDQDLIISIIIKIIDNTTKIVESDVFRMTVNNVLHLSYSKYFYASFVEMRLRELGLYRSMNLFSRNEIPYKSLIDIIRSNHNHALSLEQNMESLKNKVLLTKEVEMNTKNNYIVFLRES